MRCITFALSCSLVGSLACNGDAKNTARHASTPQTRGEGVCRTLDFAGAQVTASLSQDAQRIRLRLPVVFDTLFYVLNIDLDCDGHTEILAQGVPKDPSVLRARPTLYAFAERQGTWRLILNAVSPVAGPEYPVLISPLADGYHESIVTLGDDEGGTVPRLFIWNGNGYVTVLVPKEYELRQEERWTTECRKTLAPKVSANHMLILARETISPASDSSHGDLCNLPLDTLVVKGMALERLHP
jgi:hypothetical protein